MSLILQVTSLSQCAESLAIFSIYFPKIFMFQLDNIVSSQNFGRSSFCLLLNLSFNGSN